MATFLSNAQFEALERLAAEGAGMLGLAPFRRPTIRVLIAEGLVEVDDQVYQRDRTVIYNFGRDWENRVERYRIVRLTQRGRQFMRVDD